MNNLAEFAECVIRRAKKGPVAVMVYPGQPYALVCKPLEWLRGRVIGLVGVYDKRATAGAVLADIAEVMGAK